MKLLMKIEYKQVEYKSITIRFRVIDVPVQAEKKIYDLHYLIEDNMFREKIVLKNTSQTAYKIQIFNHKDINDYIEINPNLGYIQPESNFEIWVKLKINPDIKKLHQFFRNEEEYNFPLKLIINNIKVPSIIILKFNVTTDKIELNRKFLNFNQNFTDEANILDLEMINKSQLPQKYGFIMLPPQLSVKPSIGIILPNEKAALAIKYESKDYLGHREGDIVYIINFSSVE